MQKRGRNLNPGCTRDTNRRLKKGQTRAPQLHRVEQTDWETLATGFGHSAQMASPIGSPAAPPPSLGPVLVGCLVQTGLGAKYHIPY